MRLRACMGVGVRAPATAVGGSRRRWVLSTAVGLLNLFPVPVLDGGHLVFHAWEAVTGKPPSDKALNVAMSNSSSPGNCWRT